MELNSMRINMRKADAGEDSLVMGAKQLADLV